MELLAQFMGVYRHLLHPVTVLVLVASILSWRDWRREESPPASLAGRLATILAVAVLGLVVLGLVVNTTRVTLVELFFARGWYADPVLSALLVLASGLLLALWRANGWGRPVREAARASIITAVPFAVISLYFNVSGHVTFTVVPVAYLIALDRRYWPLLLVPALMVVNRPFVGMHTWPESVAGVALGLAGVAVTRTLHLAAPTGGQSPTPP